MKALTTGDLLKWAQDLRERVAIAQEISDHLNPSDRDKLKMEQLAQSEFERADWLDGIVLAQLEQVEEEKSNDTAP